MPLTHVTHIIIKIITESYFFSKTFGGTKKIIPIFAKNIKNEGMKPKDLKKAQTLCETFQEEFIEKWHEHMDEND